jgi:mono/diheme cytochrome c family protein
MSDFVSGFWNFYVVSIVLVSVIGCGVFLWMQSSAKHVEGETTGHVWDEDLQEFSNPLPSWWRWMFYITIVFSLFYLAMYPGLGTYQGQFNWSSVGQYGGEMKKADEQYGPIFKKFQGQDIAAVAANKEAKEMGQRLFLTYCAQCHGSDAKGARGFPNLVDGDWLFGGTPEQIKESIVKGRDAMMPAKGVKPDLNGDQIKDLAAYVRSLSGLPFRFDSRPARQGTLCSGVRRLPRPRRQGHARRCAEPGGQGLALWQLRGSHHRNDHQGPYQSHAGLRRIPRRCQGAFADCLCLWSRRWSPRKTPGPAPHRLRKPLLRPAEKK